MANEVTIPILPCRDLDESIAFYEALGSSARTARVGPTLRRRRRENIQIHLFGLEDFDPEQS